MKRLQHKSIIVTGSTTGIGEAITRRFVAEGARVLVHGVEADLGAAVVASLGPMAMLHLDDLADPAAPARVVARAFELFGAVDAVVNNAAWVPRDTIADVTVVPDDWHTKLPAMWAPSGGLIPAETIAAAAVFWVGDESRPVSGSVVDLGQFPFIGRNPPKKL
ncbi:MAG: SDR family NAD(P)-dependent oxidoreductase [Planctomycetota bacterium]|nr:SDR family NAD(P)-dependent oxidoreductase [Planctomycetota bacterium]